MPKKKNKPLRVVELFAGVGGFRLGLEGYNGKSPLSGYKKPIHDHFKVIWSNQWEPSTNKQHANEVYNARWAGSKQNHNGENIEDVIKDVPEHDVLVGGFPCQDYSVATTLKNSKGLIGIKGVLWWSIYSILKNQGKKKPKYLILENVDRLLVSPASQRGRDFGVMLNCLNELGYIIEWRVINAADYGMPQRRRRTFIVGYHKNTQLAKSSMKLKNIDEWIFSKGVFASQFKIDQKLSGKLLDPFSIKGTVKSISKNFNKGGKFSPFQNTGIMVDGICHTVRTVPIKLKKTIALKDVLENEKKVEGSFYINSRKRLNKKFKIRHLISDKPIKTKEVIIKTEGKLWEYLKGSKKILRKTKNRNKDLSDEFHYYKYAEGRMIYPDNINKPSRTIITGEGGISPSRFKHVIKTNDGRLRRLTPLELERLNMFPDNHTKLDSITDTKRAFFMGNALVVGVVEKIGKRLSRMHFGV
jgi:DNA (cytosine-5)-methyltransferase 1